MSDSRIVSAYHGCDAETAKSLLAGAPFKPSANDFDWLGHGIYFWEEGPDRALRFAKEQQRRNKVANPTIIGVRLRLGLCFDLMDTRFTEDLAAAYEPFERSIHRQGLTMPKSGGPPPDHKLRHLDCAVLNWYLGGIAQRGPAYDTVRCGFSEGERVYPGSGIFRETHIQIAVRSAACILDVFQPSVLAGE